MSTPRNPANGRHQATFRIPGDLLERLDHEADVRVIGRSKLVELLLRDALDRLPPMPDIAPPSGSSPTHPKEDQ